MPPLLTVTIEDKLGPGGINCYGDGANVGQSFL